MTGVNERTQTNIIWTCSSRFYHIATITYCNILNKDKHFLQDLTDCLLLHAKEYKMGENASSYMLLKLKTHRV